MQSNKRSYRLKAIALTFVLCLVLTAAGGGGSARYVAVSGGETRLLIPGGMPFGVKFDTEGVLVVGFSSGTDTPAYAAGIRTNDVIVEINGKKIVNADTLAKEVNESQGSPVTLTVKRDGEEFFLRVTPFCDKNGKWRTGILVRDSGAGIGTVTFILPRTLAFGGLGHGICDADTGKVIPLSRGTAMNVKILGVTKGKVGTPGEVRGSFDGKRSGSVISNTESGVFGIFSALPQTPYSAMETARKSDVTAGKATVLCTLDDGKINEYSVEIFDVDRSAVAGKCFCVRVTDKALLEKTGGIIQGMSGSPIIQNGKLVGAVTHVLINDPTTGYGIFIENMLENLPDTLK